MSRGGESSHQGCSGERSKGLGLRGKDRCFEGGNSCSVATTGVYASRTLASAIYPPCRPSAASTCDGAARYRPFTPPDTGE